MFGSAARTGRTAGTWIADGVNHGDRARRSDLRTIVEQLMHERDGQAQLAKLAPPVLPELVYMVHNGAGDCIGYETGATEALHAAERQQSWSCRYYTPSGQGVTRDMAVQLLVNGQEIVLGNDGEDEPIALVTCTTQRYRAGIAGGWPSWTVTVFDTKENKVEHSVTTDSLDDARSYFSDARSWCAANPDGTLGSEHIYQLGSPWDEVR